MIAPCSERFGVFLGVSMIYVHPLVPQFKDALVRGEISPIEMCRVLYEINASLMNHWPEIFDGIPFSLDDMGDEVYIAITNFGTPESEFPEDDEK